MKPEVKTFIDEHFPDNEWRATVCERECGDVQVVYLHDLDHNFIMSCKVLYYNTWYPGEFNLYKLEPIELEEMLTNGKR